MQFSKFLTPVFVAAILAGFASAHAQDNPAQAAARAALLQAMGSPSAPAEQPNAPTWANPPAATPATNNGSATTAPAAASQPTNSETQTAERAALVQSMNQPPAAMPASASTTPKASTAPPAAAPTPATPLATAPVAAAPATTTANAAMPGYVQGFAPMVAPPLPISAEQQARLSSLNASYLANQISPEDYFKQREAIIKGQ